MLREKRSMLDNYAEVGVLGSMLIDDRCIGELMQQLTPDDFPDTDARHIFEAIQSLFLARSPIDPVTVQARLGTRAYKDLLAACIQQTPTTANCDAYARILRDNRQLREIQTACMAITEDGVDLARAREILAGAAGLLVDKQNKRDRSYGELISDLIDRQRDRTPPDHLDFGIPALTEKLALGPGKFAIIGADSSVGKTALALQFALEISKKKSVGFFSYETTLADAADRLVANDADVSLGRTKHKLLGEEEMQQVVAAGVRSADRDLRILETARYTVEDIRAKTIARGFEVIFVDYVQLIPTRKHDRYEAVTDISIGLHAIAQELGVTVIGLSQVTVPETNRSGDRRYISKDDLRESRQLKQDADVILLMDLVDPKDRDGNRVLIIDKNRDGPLGHLILNFRPSRMRFDYVPPYEDPETAKARERCAKMDANRAERLRKEAEKARGGVMEGQDSIFRELPNDEGGDIPFG